jgi:uncharacterized protein (TIGR00369 family)
MSVPDLSALTTGRELLEVIRDGRLEPPQAAVALGLDLEVVEDGRTVMAFHPHERFGNGDGAVNGGILAAVADFTTTTAITTRLPIEAGLVTTNLNATFLRPVVPSDGTLRCEGRVVHLGHRLGYAEATLTGVDGGPRLRATATCHVRLPRPARTDAD